MFLALVLLQCQILFSSFIIGDIAPVIDRFEDLDQYRAMEELHISGSAQFTEAGLVELKKKLAGKSLLICDLRRESHGFIDTIPIGWMLWDTNQSNLGWSIAEIEEDETKKLAEAASHRTIRVYRQFGDTLAPVVMTITAISTESNLSAREALGYLRVPISDHMGPDLAQVNQIVELYKATPKEGWVHFHCRGGRGRTSTALAMWDMLTNAKYDTLETILDRQLKTSNYNLSTASTPNTQVRYKEEFEAKIEFLQSFYQYCKNNTDNYATPYAPPQLVTRRTQKSLHKPPAGSDLSSSHCPPKVA